MRSRRPPARITEIVAARWPFIDGGATPALARERASERVFGDTFPYPAIRGVAAS